MSTIITQAKEFFTELNTQSIWVGVRLLVFVLLFLVMGSYIVMVNSSVVGGYRLSKLEGELSQKKDTLKKMSMDIVELESYAKIQNDVRTLPLVKATTVSYVEQTTSLVLNK